MQNRAIEIHDSALNQIILESRAVVLHLPCVYIHSSEGRPGIDAGTGWTQQAILRIEEAHVEGQFPREAYSDDVFYLSDGQIEVNGTVFDNMIPVPPDVRGSIELQMECWGEVIRVRGTAAKLELIGTARYVEEFQP